jgi:hypothetical protein
MSCANQFQKRWREVQNSDIRDIFVEDIITSRHPPARSMSARSNKSIDAPKSGAALPPLQATADRFSAVLRIGQMQDLKQRSEQSTLMEQRLAVSRSVAAAGLTELSDLTEDVGPPGSKRDFEGGTPKSSKAARAAVAFRNVDLLSYSPDIIRKWYPYVPFEERPNAYKQHSLRALDVWFKYLRVYTMGEAAKFYISDAQDYGEWRAELITLTSNIGPFKDESITLTGNASSILYRYADKVLSKMLRYLDHAHIVYHSPTTKACYLHGGFGNMDSEKYAEAFDTSPLRVGGAHYNTTALSDVKKDMVLDDFHMLGMNGISPITGKLEPKNNGSDDEAKKSMHPTARITVVGHTPQSQGIPTIIRVFDGADPVNDRFLIQLDTQRTDRVHNTHCLAINTDGKFKLRGTFQPKGDPIVYGYEAMCSDPAIGNRINGIRHGIPGEKPYLRCVGRVTEPTAKVGKYIWVSYYETPTNRFAGETRILEKDEVDIMLTFQTDEQRLQNPFNNTPEGMELVCGDVEASVPFLRGFLGHALKIVDAPRPMPSEAPSDSLHHAASTLKRLGCTIASIGDVIGDPTGLSQRDTLWPTDDDEFCIEFMLEHAHCKLCGNRDINKLRLFHEIHAFMNSGKADDLMELLRIYDLDLESANVQFQTGTLVQNWPSRFAGNIKEILGRGARPQGMHMGPIKTQVIDIP